MARDPGRPDEGATGPPDAPGTVAARRAACPALRRLVRLDSELAAVGVNAMLRHDLHALAVPTVKPGTYLWIYTDPAHGRFLCYLNNLCEQLSGDPRTVARDIAAFARAGR